MDEHRRHKTPPLMIKTNCVISLRAECQEDLFRKRAPQRRRRHPTGFPHQKENKKVRNEKDNRENVGPREDCARVPHGVSLTKGDRLDGWLKRRAANMTRTFARANQGATVSADARTTGIGWWSVGQVWSAVA